MSIHNQCVGATDERYTPKYIFDAMGVVFDMDVASPGSDITWWIPAKHFIEPDGPVLPWVGFVWMNPPFGARNGLVPWLSKFIAHGQGVALVPDRTSAPWWQDAAPKMDALLFVSPKIRFLRPSGTAGTSPADGTSLMAMGPQGVQALTNAKRNGLGVMVIP